MKTWNTFTAVADKVLDIDFEDYYLCKPYSLLLDRVINDIINFHPEEEHKAGIVKRS